MVGVETNIKLITTSATVGALLDVALGFELSSAAASTPPLNPPAKLANDTGPVPVAAIS